MSDTTPTPTPAPVNVAAPAAAAAPAPGAPKPIINYDDFAKVDLRVATILAAEPHPNADRLLKLQVDLGELGQRQICAGIKAHWQPADLIGKQIIVVANLEPRKIRGEVSNGMLLAASAKTGEVLTDVVVLAPARPVPPGSSVA